MTPAHPKAILSRMPEATPQLSRLHWQRLRRMYRSSGWPFLDNIEIDLIAAGLLERVVEDRSEMYMRVTDAGLQGLASSLNRNRRARNDHEALVERVARQVTGEGRIAYSGLKLRAKLDGGWRQVRPDVYSIRSTTVADYLCPVVHEIKVRRGDLLADLNKPDKRAGYLFLAAQCFYVLEANIATPDEIPAECGVIIATETDLELARPAPHRQAAPDFGTWMALARATPVRPFVEPDPML